MCARGDGGRNAVIVKLRSAGRALHACIVGTMYDVWLDAMLRCHLSAVIAHVLCMPCHITYICLL